MFEPSKRIQEIVESETLAMTKKARELKESGQDIISLSIGEPDFNTPLHICEAAYEAMKAGHTHYPPVLGVLAFREAVCRKLKTENGLDYTPDCVIVSNGAKHSIINAVMSIINPGDEVIVPAPYWVSYPSMVEYAGGVLKEIFTDSSTDYKPTAAQIEAAITPKTKLLIFSSPTNPSGSVWNKEELAAIGAVLQKYPDIFIIHDEIYEKINYTGTHTSFASIEGMKDRTAVVNGLAKGYAMTGWRIGYLAGPKWLVSACEKYQGLFTSGASTISQMAGIAALEGTQAPLEDMKAEFLRRRDYVLERLSAIKGMICNVPEGAFYVFPDISYFFGKKSGDVTIESADHLCLHLLATAQVACVSGKAFGAPKCIRLSYATDMETLAKAMDRLVIAFNSIH